jgi:hypothetical protein
LLEAGHNHEKGRFSRPARTNDPDRLAMTDGEIYAAQYMDAAGPALQAEMDIFEFDDIFGHGRSVPVAK